MRRVFLLLLFLAATGGAQWRHFGEAGPSSAASSPAALSLSPSTAVAREMLAAHNVVRARVETAPLAWSDRLAARAQDWADTLLTRNQFAHRPKPAYGENLFEITGAAPSSPPWVHPLPPGSADSQYTSNTCRGL